MNINSIIQSKSCNGCLLCAQICPKNAITIQKDEENFFKPYIDNNKCIDCSICYNNCSSIKINKNNLKKVFLFQNNDKKEVINSSSGGFFQAISKLIFENNGNVFATSFDENLILSHKKVPSISELKDFQKSKYLKSSIKDVFIQIEQSLIQNKPTLFIGTPCQIVSIKNYLEFKRIDCKNLILVDLICHGVPSQDFFSKYIEKERIALGADSITSFKFRAKKNKKSHSHFFEIIYKKNNHEYKINKPYVKSIFYYLYIEHIIYKESCYSCKYATSDRVSDITIGDFWGLPKVNKKLSPHDGYNIVGVNSEKGMSFVKELQSCLLKEVDKDCINLNYSYTKITKRPNARDNVLKDFEVLDYDKFILKYQPNKKLDIIKFNIKNILIKLGAKR